MGSFAHMTLRIKNVLQNTKGIESLARVREGFEKCVEGRLGVFYVSDLNLQTCPPCGATCIATRPLWGSGILENKIWIVRRDKYMIYVPPWKLFLLREKCQYEIQIHSRVLALLEIFWKSAISVQSGDQNLVGSIFFKIPTKLWIYWFNSYCNKLANLRRCASRVSFGSKKFRPN